MSQYHLDERVDSALHAVADALAVYQKETGQRSSLILFADGFKLPFVLVGGEQIAENEYFTALTSLAIFYERNGGRPDIANHLNLFATNFL